MLPWHLLCLLSAGFLRDRAGLVQQRWAEGRGASVEDSSSAWFHLQCSAAVLFISDNFCKNLARTNLETKDPK